MGNIPKFIHFSSNLDVEYPFGALWNYKYIKECAKIIYDTYKTEIEDYSYSVSITFVVQGTSGAMIAGAVLTEIHYIDPRIKIYILIVRKEDEIAHGRSLLGLFHIGETKLIVIDDFVTTGSTIKNIINKLDTSFDNIERAKYDMLCISNAVGVKAMKKNTSISYKLWKEIYSRFNYVVGNKIPNR